MGLFGLEAIAMYAELKGKVAIVSGAGGTLGTAVVRRLAVEGVRLVLIDRNEAALTQLVSTLGLAESDTALGGIDLTQPAEVDRFLEEVIARFGRIDVLINIAGGFVFSGPVHQMKLEDLDAMFAVNVKTAWTLSAAAARRMVANKTEGRIINIGARAGLQGPAGMAAYSASKSAVLRLTESMAAELLENRITVNAVLPSTIDTPPNRKAMPNADYRRWVSPDSLADVIAFLASDAARDISGAAIPVYGRA
jgi:NAD(P)-dependent dehydrogenase (short-subunit alcohol dehydrogenase family)